MSTRVILTYKDYEALPADGRRYEIHDGELSVTPAPSTRHQRFIRNLAFLLHEHVQGLGEVLFAPIDCILSDRSIIQPDIVYLDSSRLSLISARGIEGAPALVVEALSPSTVQIDRGVKLQLYARYGIPYYWIADPEDRVIEAYHLVSGAYDLAARLAGPEPAALPPFPDLALAPSTLWA